MSAPSARTLVDRLRWRATEAADDEALRFGGRSWSYGELWRGIERFAGAVLARGVEPGDRVVVAVPNGPEFFISFYGAILGGAIAVPVSPASGGERLIAIGRRCDAALVITGDPAIAERVDAADGLTSLDPTALPGDASDALPELDPDAVAYLQYTSGSSGEPKGVQISHANALINVEQMIEGMGIHRQEVFVSWLPVHHDMGLVLMTMVPFHLGARLVLLPASLRDVRGWLSAIERHRGTFTAAPDFAYRLALRSVAGREQGYDLSSLRVALNAAEPVRRRTLDDFERAFGLPGVMVPGYGLAEATVGVSMWSPGRPVAIGRREVPSVGRPFPRVELAVAGSEGHAAVGEEGEILVRSPANTRGYWRDARATAALLDSDGYLHTGDLGYLDAAGNLYVVGRRKNIIIHAGRNIAPREVEEMVDAFPYVRASAAVGIERGGLEGEQLYVFAELRRAKPPPREACRRMVVQLTHHLRRQLGLGPGRLYLVPPRTIPRTHNGKMRHAELAKRYRDGTLARRGSLLYPGF